MIQTSLPFGVEEGNSRSRNRWRIVNQHFINRPHYDNFIYKYIFDKIYLYISSQLFRSDRPKPKFELASDRIVYIVFIPIRHFCGENRNFYTLSNMVFEEYAGKQLRLEKLINISELQPTFQLFHAHSTINI